MSFAKKMLEAISESDLAQATVYFNESLSKDLPEEKIQLADNLYQLGFLEEAKTLFLNLLETFPKEDSLYISLAEIAIEENKIEEAFEWLEKIDPKSELYPQSLMSLADIYQMLGIPEVSEQKLKEAKTYLPKEPLIDLAMAELFFANEDYVKAIEYYELLKESSETFESPIDLDERIGVSLSRIGEFESAIEFLEASVKKEETVERLFQLALTYYQIGENDRSISLLEKTKDLNEEFHQVYYPLSQILHESGQYEKALAIAEEGIKVNPYETILYHLASDNAYHLGFKAEARMYLEEVIGLEVDSDFSKLKLAEFLIKEAEYEEVLSLIETLENKDQGLAYWYVAQAHKELENFSEALSAYTEAHTYLETEAEFLKDYGFFLREEGQLEASRSVLETYLMHVPDDMMVVSILENN